jgi:hypothetical protein
MKKIILSTSLLFIGFCKVFSQNHAVIVPPYFYNAIDGAFVPLPIPTNINLEPNNLCVPGTIVPNDPTRLIDGYDGRPALASSNMMVDTNGRLLFFIVDGVIFNSKGFGVATLPGYNDIEYQYLSGNENAVHGSNEITIVPDLTNCDRYYILSVDTEDVGAFLRNDPQIVLYNTASEQIETFFPLTSLTSGNALFTANGSVRGKMGYSRYANPAIAATKVQENGSQFIIFSLGTYFAIAKTTADGLLPVSLIEKNLALEGGNINRPELEVYDLPNGNHILATQYSNATSHNHIGLFTFNSDFTILLNEDIVPILGVQGPSTTFVHGLEFSPNGQFLYFTHNTTSQLSGQLKYINLSTLSIQNITVPSNINLQYSGIELQKVEVQNNFFETSFLFATPNGLVKMNNPNSPSNVTFTNVSNFINPFNHGTTNAAFQSNQTKIYQLPDQIDDQDYSQLKYMSYDASIFYACESATWQPNTSTSINNNPFTTGLSTVVFIEKELRIPAGKNITIKNMIFKFAPGAKVIVDRSTSTTTGTGGNLTLDNTTFTVDDRCHDDLLWMGVEVEGHPSVSQFTSNSKQGFLFLKNKSVISHAFVGALASRRIVGDDPYSDGEIAFNGGIIIAKNSSFLNNRCGIQILDYNSPTNSNNLSNFDKCTFKVDDEYKLLESKFFVFSYLREINGVTFKGNLFKNDIFIDEPNELIYYNCYGIFALNSKFSVIPSGTQLVPTENNKSNFENLKKAIYVYNPNKRSFLVDNSNFTDNWKGIHAVYARNEQITRNKIKVREININDFGVDGYCYGVFLNYSSGYMVEENVIDVKNNSFIPQSLALNFGVIVENSLYAENRIYNNTFKNLRIGGQSQYVNGIKIGTSAQDIQNYTGTNPITGQTNTMSGLKWKCNKFVNTLEHDLTVYNGQIDYHQGTTPTGGVNPVPLAANNIFSLTGESISLEHDITLRNAQLINYVHLGNANRIPLSSTINSGAQYNGYVTLTPILLNNLPVNANATACPSTFTTSIGGPTGPIDPKGKILLLKEEISTLQLSLDEGASQDLKSVVENATNFQSLKQLLLSKSPYLSSEILIAYLKRNPGTGQMKDVMLANSALDVRVTDSLLTVTMPNGTRNQILAKQGGVSARALKEQELQEKIKELIAFEDQYIAKGLNDTIEENRALAIEIMEGRTDFQGKLDLFDFYITEKNINRQSVLREEILAHDNSIERTEMTDLQMEIATYPSVDAALKADSSLLLRLEILANESIAEDIKIQSLAYLQKSKFKTMDSILYEPLQISGAKLSKPFNEEKIESTPTFVTVYPNPATNFVNLDFAAFEDGKFDVQFFDLAGKIVFEKSFENTNGEKIDVSEIKRGFYLVKVIIDKQVVEVQKLELK